MPAAKYSVGTIHANKNGEKFIIIKRLPKNRVLIKFLENNEYDYVKEIGVCSIAMGSVLNPYKPTVMVNGQLIGIRGVVDGLNITSKEWHKWKKVINSSKQYPQKWKVLEFFIKDVRKTENYNEWVSNENLALRTVCNNGFIVGFEVCNGCNNSKPLQIRCLYSNSVETFNSLIEASEELGWHYQTITQFCNENKIVDGYEYSWLKYEKESEE